MNMKTGAIVLASMLGCMAPVAGYADALTIHVASYHFKDSAEYNQINPGVGYRKEFDGYFAMTGVYKNSLGNTSFYVGGGKQLYARGAIEINLVAGLFSGYNDPVIIAAFPEVAYRVVGNSFIAIGGIPPKVVTASYQIRF